MKNTKVIAGLGVVAGLGLAVLPMATYADDIVSTSDQLNITVTPTCTFVSAGTGGGLAAENTTNYYTASVQNGESHIFSSDDSLNIRTIKVTCNNNSGYHIYATPTALTGTGSNTATIAYTEDVLPTTGDNGLWHMTTTAVTSPGGGVTGFHVQNYTTSTPDIAYNSGAAYEDTFRVGYGVYVGETTPADVYTGTVTFTFTNGS